MEKLDGKSKDILKENIEKLKQIFPEIVSEGNIDFDKLKTTLGEYVDDGKERYSFTWNGKAQAKRLAQTPSTGTLRPCKEESVNWDTTENLFIEGDNLEVLKLLQKAYHKKIKMIYIDPPYNTGKDFIYKDNFKDNIKNYLELTGQVDGEGKKLSVLSETSGRYHTDWLNMMYPRLFLAKNLLRDDGVIFISIDDTEVDNLKKICNEIFGAENFVANIIWQKKFSRANDASYFSTMHDYVLCYAKNSKLNSSDNPWELRLLPRGDEIPDGYSNPDDDPRGNWTSVVLSAKSGTPKLVYEITTPSGRKCLPPDGRFWGVNKERFEELVKDGRIWFGKDGNGIPRLKTFLSEVQGGLRPNTIWFHQEVGHNQEGRQEVKSLFSDKAFFDGPKPVRLLNQIIQTANTQAGDIVLDFFAGSATTAHAVMQLNAENGSNRKFIMVQLPGKCEENSEAYKAGFKTIADIGKERIRRVIKKIESEQKEDKKKSENTLFNDNNKQEDKPLDLGFKVFKLNSSNIKTWDSDFDSLEKSLLESVDNIKKDRSAEDVLYEILLKYGLDLTLPIEEKKICNKIVYSIGMGALIVCLDKDISLDVVEGIAKLKKKLNPEVSRVVFSDAGFKDDVVKTNTVQILKQHGIEDVKSI